VAGKEDYVCCSHNEIVIKSFARRDMTHEEYYS
jgi:hypothetical protein